MFIARRSYEQGCLLDKIFFRNGHADGGVGLQTGGGGGGHYPYITLKSKTGSCDLETHL